MKVTARRPIITRSPTETVVLVRWFALYGFVTLATILGAFHIMPS